MRSVLFALAFAGLAAAQLSPHVGDAWESPATEYCSHSEDPAGHKCYEGCATRPFKNKGLAQPGVCNPHLFNTVTSTKNLVQCSDGVTNLKFCAAPLYTVTVTQKTLGENAVEVLAEASVPCMFVHQIVTSPGDHCLEISIPGGAGSPFWKAEAWKYSAPDRPEWKTGACDHTKWDEVDSTTDNYDGYTAAKNSPYAAVSLNKYGIKTATPAPTPIPNQIEQNWSKVGEGIEQYWSKSTMKCETTTGTHSVTVTNPLKIDLVVRTCDKYDPVSGAPCTGNMLKPNHYIDCPQNIGAGSSSTFTFNGDTQYIAFIDASAHIEINEMWPSPVGKWPSTYTVKPAAVSVAFDICDPTGFVHALGTDGNDKGKCLEITFGGGKGQSHFWQTDGWKYSNNKVWSDGKCDRTAFTTVSSFTKDFGGWTAATNSDQVPSCGNVNFTKFNPAAEVEAEFFFTGVPSMFVHQIVTSPGDHCLEITIPGGAGSPFWKAEAWKYSAPDRPEWKTGACDHTKWDEVDSTTDNYDGYTAAKNSPYAAVSLNKYGIKTATPAPTPIPDEVEELFDTGPRQCTSNKDCACSYCQIVVGKKGPYFCHGSVCCKSDKDCPGSYCMNSSSKTAPFYCH